MKIVVMQFVHIETYHYYFKEIRRNVENGKTKKKDIYYVTIHWKCK